VLRNTGEIVQGRFRMDKGRVKSVGISFLGGHSGIEGRYQLAIDSIRAVNEEDADILGKPSPVLSLISPQILTSQRRT
jgi:hypothetical protein